MSELEETPRTYSGALLGVIAAALVCALGSLIWCYTLSNKASTQATELADAKQENVKLAAELRETDARLQVTSDELGKSLGLTQKQMDDRAQQLIAREEANEANAKRLETAQKQTAQQVTAVASDVSSDVAKTQSDLASTISQLMAVKGDLSSTNSVIARNHDELVLLQHKGDRNYVEFTINKGQKKPVGTVSLELKKTDQKKNKFTLNILADDKNYEKKDRNVNEPLQFYSGKDPALFEIVVNSINSKNQISGYLSMPKSH
jgi:multidrug efflux pump subunit AcrA (membrane-fusion protein)